MDATAAPAYAIDETPKQPEQVAPVSNGPKSPPLTAALVRDAYERATKTIRAEALEYWLNHAYLLGQQWLWFNTETRRLDQIPRDPERVQVTINKMWPSSRTIISRGVSRELTFDVIPSSPDDATIRGSRIGEAILADVHRRHDWENLRELALWAVWKGGTAAVSVEWDSTALDTIGQDPVSGKSFGRGDTREDVLSIVEMVVEPGAWDAETARWWIKAKTLPPEQVQALYHLPKKPPADATAGLTPFQNRLLNDARKGGGERADLTLVLTYFERPNWLRPDGAVCTVVDNKIVDGPAAWPFPFKDRLNFALMRETKVNNRWTGETVVSMARPVQTALNASWSSIIEHMKLAGNARLFIPQSALEIIDELTDLPGELVPYPDGTNPPQWSTPPQMPQWWIEQPQILAGQMDDILGTHDVSKGDAPTNIESGIGLAILAENDTTPLTRLTKETGIAWSKVGTMVLQCYAKYVRETRQARVGGEPGQPPNMEEWTGKDLAGQTTAQVPLDAILHRSRAAQQAFAERAMQMGLIQTAEQFAKLADLPDQKDLIEAVSPDVARARRENHYLAMADKSDAVPPVPESWDDHNIHIHEHNNFRKSVRYELLDPAVKNLIDAHIKGHETLGAEQLGSQLQKSMHSPVLGAAPDADGAPQIPIDAAAAAQSQQMAAPPVGPDGMPAEGGGPPGAQGAEGTPSPTGPAAANQPPLSAPGGTPPSATPPDLGGAPGPIGVGPIQ